MPDDIAQDTQGQVAQPNPIPEIDVTATKLPGPTPEDVEFLNSHPEAWTQFEDHFGQLPKGWSATTPKHIPTQEDIDFLKAHPDGAEQFKAHFGDLPPSFEAPQKGPKASTGDVLTSAETNIGAGIERIGAGAQEAHGNTVYEDARKQYWQALVLPDAVKDAQKTGRVLTDDPNVIDAAKHLGIRPDVFTRDWQAYAKMTPEQRQEFMAKQTEQVQTGMGQMEQGRRRRETAGQVEAAYTPLNPSKLQSFALNMASYAPEALGGFALSMIPGGAVPVTAMLTTDFGLRAYSQGRDAGLNDQQAKLYGILSGAATAVPQVPLSAALSKAPGSNLIIMKALGQVMNTGVGKVAGTALDQATAMTVMDALQMGIDKGILNKDMSLPDALSELGKGFLNGAVFGAATGAAHAGVHRAAHGPQTPADLQDQQAHDEILKQDQEQKTAAADEQAKAQGEAAKNAPPRDPAMEANENGLRALLSGEQVDPNVLNNLQAQGLITIGKKTGAPMVLPAGKRLLAQAETTRQQAAKEAAGGGEDTDETKTREARAGARDALVPTDQDRGAAAPAGGEAADEATRAPRTPVEAEDAAGAETRRAQAFEQTEAAGKEARQADTERAYAAREAEQTRGKDEDFGKAKGQVAEQTIEQAPHVSGNTPQPMVSVKEAMDVTNQRAAQVAASIPRQAGLSPEEREMESRFVNKIAANPQAVFDEYARIPDTMGGKIVGADNARLLSEDYQKDPTVGQAIHEPSSWVAGVLYRRALAQPPKPGEDNLVLLTAGAPGSGKSSTLERAGPLTSRAQVIYDAVLATPESAVEKVRAAREAGKWVSIAYVHADPRDNFRDTLLRAEEIGRTVPADFQIAAHKGSPEAMRAILKEFADDPHVQLVGIDNSLGDGKAQATDIEDLLSRDTKITKGEMRSIARELLNEGKISPDVYERTLGETPPARGEDKDAGRGAGKSAEQERAGHEGGQAAGQRKPELTDEEKGRLARSEARARRRFTEERARRADVATMESEPFTKTVAAMPSEVWGKWITGGFVSSKEVMDQVVKYAADPRLKVLAEALQKYVPDVSVDFAAKLPERIGGRITAGAGNQIQGTLIEVALRPSAMRPVQLKAVLHELTHAATMYEIDRNPSGPLAVKLGGLMVEARKRVAGRYGEDVLNDHLDYFKGKTTSAPEGYMRELYGLTNVHEFVAEAMSNPNFQELLTEITPPDRMNRAQSTGIFTKFVQIVRDFLSKAGVGVNSSLLEDVIAAGGEIMKAQQIRVNAANEFNQRVLMDRENPGDDVAHDVLSNRMTKLVTAAAEMGALKIARGISRFEDWKDAMTQELGEGIKPALDQLYQLAKDRMVDVKGLIYKTTKAGTLVGGPQGGFTSKDIAPLRAQLRKLAREGEYGKDWYKQSSEALVNSVGGNRADAKRLAGLFSIFSTGAAVDANTTMALRAWYQWKAGEPISSGTDDVNTMAQKWLNTGVEPTGMKRSNFYGNLLQSLEGDQQRMYSGGVTVDRWMLRALGYTREAPSDAQYAFVADQIRRLAKQLKWSPEQVQAAVWVSIKARWEAVRADVVPKALAEGWVEQQAGGKARTGLKVNDPERYYGAMLDAALKTTLGPDAIKKAAQNFSDALAKHRAQVSWEAMPGVASGRLRGAADLAPEALESFQRDVAAAHLDPKTGNDQLQQALGLLSHGRVNGNSAWFRDPGQVLRFRHWGPEGISVLAPEKQGTGSANLTERTRANRVISLYPYDLAAGQPEPHVAAGRQEYVVEAPAGDLYDASRDPRGYRDAAQEPVSFTGDGEPTAYAYSHDAFEQLVKDGGFKGYYVSDRSDPVMGGQARLFQSWPATPAEKFVEPTVQTYVKAGAQDVLYAPLEKGAAQKAGAPLDPNARAAMESYAAALGKVNNQDSVGWHRPRFGVAKRDGNGIEVRVGKPDRDDFMRAYKAVYDAVRAEGVSDARAAEFAPIQTPDGMRFINWGVLENLRFQQLVGDALGQTFGMRNPTITHFAADGGLIYARDFDTVIAGNGHGSLLAGPVADIGRRLEPIYREFAQRNGLEDPAVQRAGQGAKVEASAPVPVDRLNSYPEIAGRFGKLDPGAEGASLKLYPIDPGEAVPKAEALAKTLGYGIQYFSFESDPSKGVEFRLPQLGKRGYEGGQLWLYDPRNTHGSFHDVEYTRAWRIAHELGHAITEPFMQSRYGDSRRYGRLGQEMMITRGALGKQIEVPTRGLTLAEAQRAVEWEDVAFRAQRVLMEKLGIPISDPDYARENNVNMSDAMYRVLSGDFGDPVAGGFIPSDQLVPVKDVLTALAGTEAALAKSQGREPTAGMDLDSWRPVTDDEIRRAIEAKQNGVKDVKFSVRAKDSEFRVRVTDNTGAEIAGPHNELLFANREDAEDHVQTLAAQRASEIQGDADHNEGWSNTKKAGRVDRTFSTEPVAKDPYKNQLAEGKNAPGAAGRFLKEFNDHYPQTMAGESLVNGHVVVGMVSDPINEGTAYISYVRSIVPGNGEGTKAMRDVVGLADKHGVTLELNAVPMDAKGIPNEKLIEWYKKLGFEIVEPAHTEPEFNPVTGAMKLKTGIENMRSISIDNTGGNSQFMRRAPKDKPEQVPLYQTNAGKGISAEEAASVIEHAKRMFPGVNHHLLDSIEDAPHDVQAIAETRGLTDRVSAVYARDYDGTHVYLIRNNTTSVDAAISDMIHENVGHDGIAKTFGERAGTLMDGFLRNMDLRNVIQRVAEHEGINLNAAKDPLERREAWRAATEEWLAYTAGQELRGSDVPRYGQVGLATMISEMRIWLASRGIPIKLNRADALTMLTKAHRYVSTGAWLDRVTETREAAERDGVKFSVVPKSGNVDLDELLNDKIGAPNIGWRTRISAAMHDIRSRLVTSGLDRMNRVKEYEDDLKVPPAESGYMSMRLSTNVAPLLRNLIEFGHLKWTGTAGFDPDKSMIPDYTEGKPLNRVLAPIHNDPAMLRRFEGYLVALRARELAGQGRENLLEARHIAAGLDLGRQYPHFVQMQRDIMALNKNVLDFAQHAGVIDPESRKMWESDYYVPFYRVTDDAGGGPWSAGSLAKVRNPIMRLMGGKENLNDVTGNIVRNWSSLINAAIKAHAVRVAVDNLSSAGVAVRVPALERGRDALVSTSEVNKLLQQHGIPAALSPSAIGGIQKLMSLSTPAGEDVVQVWRGGKREYYRLSDPSLAVAFGALKGSPLRSLRDDPIGRWIVGAGTMPKMLLTKLTTENPAFGVRTLWKDNINAWTVGRGIMPVTPVVSAITGLAKTMAADGSFKRMAAAGATFNAGRADPYDTNLTAKRYMTAPSLVGRLWDGYRNMMLSGENASRVTIYDRTLAETGSHKLAAFEARDLMDYAMRGSSPIIQFMVETVPFWGAHVQGLYKTGRAVMPGASMTYTQMAQQVGKAGLRISAMAIKGSILTMLASTLYMHNVQRSDYNDLPDIQKELYYHLYFGNYHIKIPKAFESGTIFGTIPEAITEVVRQHFEPQAMKEQAAFLAHAFGAALNLYPRVTAVTPLYELQTNKDLATGFPILSEHDQGIMPQEQAGPGTSPAVAAAARAMPGWTPNALQSPKEFQHLLQGYFGIMGSYALNAADYGYRLASGMPAAPTRNLNEIPVVGSFVTRADEPAKSTKPLGELSDVMIAANQLHKTISDLQKSGDEASNERAQKLAREHLDLMIANAGMKPASDAIHDLQNMKRQIQMTPNMTADQKRERVNDIQKKIDEIARQVYEYRPGGKLNRQILDHISFQTPPAAKAKVLRDNDMPALASIATQYGRGMPSRVQAAIEELG